MFDLKLTVCECCATAIAGGECGCPGHPESTANGTEVLASFDADERHDRCDLCAAEGYLRFYEAEGCSLREYGMNPDDQEKVV